MGSIKSFTDGMVNLVANLGTRRDKSAHTEYIDSPVQDHELLAMYRNSWLAAAIVDYPAEDAIRKWRFWRADADQITRIEALEKELGLRGKALEALKAARLYGESFLYINTDDVDQSAPLKPGAVIESLVLMRKGDIRPSAVVTDISNPYYGKPEHYLLNTGHSISDMEIHASRFVHMMGRRITGVGGINCEGESVLTSSMDAIKSADSTVKNVASLVFEANVDVMRVQGFADLMASNEDDVILRRSHLQAAMKGNNGMLMMDSQDSYERKPFSFSGLTDVLQSLQENASGSEGIPVTRLFGRAASGLSGSGDGDERVYYDRIGHQQSTEIGPALSTLDDCIIHQALGDRPETIYYEWSPLRQVSEAERADIFSKTAAAARALAGPTAGEIIPLDALSDSLVNELTEQGVLPGLDQMVENYGSLSEQYGFIGGDREPESFGDAAPMPLHVSRKVTNADAIRKHYADQGVDNLIDADDMHVTITYSRRPVDWMKMGAAWNSRLTVEEGGPRLSEEFGPSNDTVVLTFLNSDLSWRHDDMVAQGASWDGTDYQPHITIAYDFTGQIDQVEPWTGEIVLGPEIFEPLEELL